MQYYSSMISLILRFQGVNFLNKQKHKKTMIFGLLIVLILLFVYFVAIFNSDPKKNVPVSVTVAAVKQQDVPVYLNALGTVTPENVVNVTTQIDGILTQVYFQDGQRVKAGEVLAEVDPRIYQAQLLQYEGQLERDQALLENAKVDLKRYQNLYKNKDVSQQTLNTQQSLVIQYEGAVKMDEGQLQQARVNLGYCQIISPIDGQISIGLISAGNYVQASPSMSLGVITSLNPMEVLFSLPEDDFHQVSEPFNAGQTLEVDVYNRDRTQLLATGKLVAINNGANITTGTVQYEAIIANSNNILFPNQFVNVALKIKTISNAITVPTEAIQQGEKNPYVYRVNQDQTVSMVVIKPGVSYQKITVVEAGLNIGDQVVTDGANQLMDGVKITITETAA